MRRSRTLEELITAFRRLRNTNRSLAEEIALVLRVLCSIISSTVIVLAPTVSIGVAGYVAAFLQWMIVMAIVLPSHDSLGRVRKLMGVGALITGAALLGIWIDRTTTLRGPIDGQARSVIPGTAMRTVNWLLPESDGVLLGSRLLSLLQGITPRESRNLFPTLERLYAEYRERHGDVPTPLVATFLGLQSATHSDMLMFRGDPHASKTRRALVFLHGFGGNWSLLCALVADSVSPLGYDTYCPSVGVGGMWSDAPGPELVDKLLHELKHTGYLRIVLAGLSAGAVGATEIAASHPGWFDAVIILFGAHPDADRIAVPTLYIYGDRDERFPPSWIGGFANAQAKVFSDVQIHVLEGADHFALIKRSAVIQGLIGAWLAKTHTAGQTTNQTVNQTSD